MVTVILLLLCLSHTLMAASVSLGYLDCQPFKVERMAQCAARHQILDLISFSCYEPGKRGPCEEGKRLVLNKESSVSRIFVNLKTWIPSVSSSYCLYVEPNSQPIANLVNRKDPKSPQNNFPHMQCTAPLCVSMEGCKEDELHYQGSCWTGNMTEPCLV